MKARKTTAEGLSNDVEISPVVKPDKTWNFRVNDERVTYEQWVQFNEDHKKWIKEQENIAMLEDEPVKKRKK